jgi:hypothetical protein
MKLSPIDPKDLARDFAVFARAGYVLSALGACALALLAPDTARAAAPELALASAGARRACWIARPMSTRVTPKGTPSASTLAPGSAGMRVTIDPETGETIVPPAAERRSFAEQVGATPSRSLVDYQVIRLRDGTRVVHLGESFMHYSFARRDAAGRFHTDCAPSLDEALRALREVPVTTPPAVEK